MLSRVKKTNIYEILAYMV